MPSPSHPITLAILSASLLLAGCGTGSSVVGGAPSSPASDVPTAPADAPTDASAVDAPDASTDVPAVDAPTTPDAPGLDVPALPSDAPPPTDTPVADAPPIGPTAIETAAPSTLAAGQVLTVTCTLLDALGAPFPTPSGASLTPVFTPADAVRLVGGRFIAARAGDVTVACRSTTPTLVDATPSTVRITPGPAATTTVTLDHPRRLAGETVTATCAALDAYGNAIPDASPALRLDPMPSGTTVTGLSAVVTRAGNTQVYCDLSGAMPAGAMLTVTPALPSTITLRRDPDQMTYGLNETVTVVPTVSDRYGNTVTDAAPTLASTPVGTMRSGGRFSYTAEGPVTVTATVPGATDGGRPLSATTSFIIDAAGPTVRCDSPAHGGMINLAPGSALAFRGTATDTQGVTRVTVNDVAAPLDDAGAFSAPITSRFGINAVTIVATDRHGLETRKLCAFLAADRWTPENQPFPNAVALRLTPAGVDDGVPASPISSLGDVLRAVLASPSVRDQLHVALLATNPLKPLSCDLVSPFGGCLASTRVDYRNVTFRGATTSSFSLVNGGLATSVRFNNVQVAIEISGSNPLVALPTPGTVTFNYVQVDAIHDLSVVGGRPRALLRVGSARASVNGTVVDVPAAGSLVSAISTAIQPTLDAAITTSLGTTVATSVGGLIGGLFDGIDVSGLANSVTIPRPDGLGTTPLGFTVGFSALNATTSSLTLGLNTLFSTTVQRTTPAPFGIPLPPSSSADSLTTPATGSYELGLWNQLFFSLWRGGLLDTRLPVGGSDLSDPGAPYARISATLPFLVGPATAGRVAIDFGAVDIDLVIPALFAAPVHTVMIGHGTVPVSIAGDSLRFGAVTLEPLTVNTEGTALPDVIRRSLEESLRLLLADVATGLFTSFPPIPTPSFTLPPSSSAYGLPAGQVIGLTAPVLTVENGRLVTRGAFGPR